MFSDAVVPCCYYKIFFLLVLTCTSPVSTTTLADFLDRHCGEYIQLSHVPTKSLKLSLTQEDAYSPNMDCEVTVHVHHHMKILLTFLYMDIHDVDHCQDDYLRIYNSNTTVRLQDVAYDKTFCGTKTPNDEWTSSHNNITVRFVSSDAGRTGRGFTLLLTAFHDGECSDQEFECSNRRCVDDELYGDDVDNCGDGSDLYQFPAYVTVCIVLLSVLLVIAILILAAVFWYRRKRQTQEPEVNHEHAVTQCDTSYISTIAEGTRVVSRLFSQLMPARAPSYWSPSSD